MAARAVTGSSSRSMRRRLSVWAGVLFLSPALRLALDGPAPFWEAFRALVRGAAGRLVLEANLAAGVVGLKPSGRGLSGW